MTGARLGLYILDAQRVPVQVADFITWARWMQANERRVAGDRVGEFSVSTVFLGLDHGFGGAPLLFETMVFDHTAQSQDLPQARYSTWDEAERGHEEIKAEMRRQLEHAAHLSREALVRIIRREEKHGQTGEDS